MKKTAAGIPSLCLIFAVLCMTILALMSLSYARREEKMARNSLEQTQGYYDACSRSAQVLKELESLCIQYYRSSADEAAYETALKTLSDHVFPGDPASDSPVFSADLTLLPENGFYILRIPFSDTLQLRCTVSLTFPQDSEDSLIRLIDRSSETCGTWDPDLHQNVYLPE